MQLAVSCCELYFARCCAVNWSGTFPSERQVMCSVYLTLRSDVFIFRIPKHQCVKDFLKLRKVEFIKCIYLINVLFIGFIKQWLSAYQDQFCVWFVSLDCGLLESFF